MVLCFDDGRADDYRRAKAAIGLREDRPEPNLLALGDGEAGGYAGDERRRIRIYSAFACSNLSPWSLEIADPGVLG